jgi:DNA polymerase-3 subunit epsilon
LNKLQLPSFPLLSPQLLSHYRCLSQQLLTVVDVETTGRLDGQQRVIEIALVQASLTGGLIHHQSHLINAGVQIPVAIQQLTGITETMVRQAASPQEIWPTYLTLLKKGILTGHHLAFDYGFLQQEYQQLGIPFSRSPAEQLCTVELARLLLPDLPSRRLPDLVNYFALPVAESHRALPDAMACWLLAEKLFTWLRQESDQKLLQAFGRQWLPLPRVARIFGCSVRRARQRLEAAGVQARISRSGRYLYQRQDVETLFWQENGEVQLSVFGP